MKKILLLAMVAALVLAMAAPAFAQVGSCRSWYADPVAGYWAWQQCPHQSSATGHWVGWSAELPTTVYQYNEPVYAPYW
jgi:hypothetical protein